MDITSISPNFLIFLTICSILSLLFCTISVILATYAAITVKAMEKSTHSVTYMPVDEQIDKENQAFMSDSKEKAPEWATSDDMLNKQQDAFKEDLEEQFPEFALDDEDKKIYSF
jgi:hypothetical protein